MSRVLCIPDIHSPFIIDGGIEFLEKIYKEYRCNKVVFLGDLLDNHRISRHPKDSEADGGKEEYLKSLHTLEKLYKKFPNVLACIGNHDDRYYKGVADLGYPKEMMKTLPELTQSPKGWQWAYRHVVDKVLYIHGTCYSGDYPQKAAVNKTMVNVVLGHTHTAAGVIYVATPNQLVFGMACGSLMDCETYGAAYAHLYDKKPVVGCGVVIDGVLPIYIPMPLGKNKLFRQIV